MKRTKFLLGFFSLLGFFFLSLPFPASAHDYEEIYHSMDTEGYWSGLYCPDEPNPGLNVFRGALEEDGDFTDLQTFWGTTASTCQQFFDFVTTKEIDWISTQGYSADDYPVDYFTVQWLNVDGGINTNGYTIYEHYAEGSDSWRIVASSGIVFPEVPPYVGAPGEADYVDVPNPIEDPKGFVLAVIENIGIWLRWFLVPTSDFFSVRFAQIRTSAEETFPAYFAIETAISDSTSVDSSITIGSFDFGGSQSAPATFFNPASWDPADFAGLRTLLSMMMWVWLAYFLLQRVPTLFSS
jgi:hypothetical protein